MHVEQLEVQRFRNLQPLAMTLSPAPVVLTGDNGQGKTNVLEALGLCATGRSFRNAAPREMLAYGAEAAQLRARLVRHDVRHDIDLKLLPQHRLVQVDGRALRQTSALLQIVNIVSFFPDDLRIVKGSPEERRRFLDRAIANHRPDFVDAASAYAKALKARNALLRGAPRIDAALVEVYDEQLIRHGAVLESARRESLAGLAPLAAQTFAELMPEAAPLELRLQSGLGPGVGEAALAAEAGSDGFAWQLRQALTRAWVRDRARGLTSVGPHRAAVNITLAGNDARLYASQGQQRAIVLALKLAELRYVEERIGSAPLLLLDDVSSELDLERTRLLFLAVASLPSQVWVTTTGAVHLPLPASTQRFLIKNGDLSKTTGGD